MTGDGVLGMEGTVYSGQAEGRKRLLTLMG